MIQDSKKKNTSISKIEDDPFYSKHIRRDPNAENVRAIFDPHNATDQSDER